MATFTHNDKYPCTFDLRLLAWEQYSSERGYSDTETVPLGEPYTLWIKYRMTLGVGDCITYQSEKDTTFVLEDIRRLIDELRQLASGKKNKMTFDPIEPDFGLTIRSPAESGSGSAGIIPPTARISAEMPTDDRRQSTTHLPNLFSVDVWIDYPNQVDTFYGGYGPGLYFFVEALDIEQFASQLEAELATLGSYLTFPAEN